ncbi:protein cueball-like [Glandiceps talaboti]
MTRKSSTLVLLVCIFCGLKESRSRILYTKIKAYDESSNLMAIENTGDAIYQSLLYGNDVNVSTLHEGDQQLLSALTFDIEDNLVFWIDTFQKTIVKMDLGTGNTTTIHVGLSPNSRGIGVDWVANNVYWTDTDYNWIMACDYDGLYYHTVVNTGLDEPADLVLDPQNG